MKKIGLIIFLWGSFLESKEEVKDDLIKKRSILKQFVSYSKKFEHVRSIAPKDIGSIKNPLFVDARLPKEQKISMLPNAISASEFKKSASDYKDRDIVVYCTIGYRSGLYAKELQERGFSVYNLKGGVLLWSHGHKSFYSNHKSTNKVHVYAKEWDLLHSAYRAIY